MNIEAFKKSDSIKRVENYFPQLENALAAIMQLIEESLFRKVSIENKKQISEKELTAIMEIADFEREKFLNFMRHIKNYRNLKNYFQKIESMSINEIKTYIEAIRNKKLEQVIRDEKFLNNIKDENEKNLVLQYLKTQDQNIFMKLNSNFEREKELLIKEYEEIERETAIFYSEMITLFDNRFLYLERNSKTFIKILEKQKKDAIKIFKKQRKNSNSKFSIFLKNKIDYVNRKIGNDLFGYIEKEEEIYNLLVDVINKNSLEIKKFVNHILALEKMERFEKTARNLGIIIAAVPLGPLEAAGALAWGVKFAISYGKTQIREFKEFQFYAHANPLELQPAFAHH